MYYIYIYISTQKKSGGLPQEELRRAEAALLRDRGRGLRLSIITTTIVLTILVIIIVIVLNSRD